MSGIRIEALTRRFGGSVAVDGIELDIADGEFLVLLGPSGCGKTTLLRMIAGLLEPTSGRIWLDGRDITHEPPRRRDVSMVFQSYALYPHLTVEKNIGFPLRARGADRAAARETVRDVAERLELGHVLGRRPKQLSGGQRQRVALGRALVREPKAFLMDEPLSNLDAKLRTATRVELAELHRSLGATFVYVTHDQVEAMTMATRVALLNGGRLEQVGTPAEMYDTPATVFAAGFLGTPPMNLIDARVETSDGWVTARAAGLEAHLWAGATPARDIVFGVRPEHLTLLAPGGAEPRGTARGGPSVLLEGTVTAVENFGFEEVAQVAVGEGRAALRGPRPLGVREGRPVRLAADPDRVHLFDRATGRRLVRDPAAGRTPGDRPAAPAPVPAVSAAPTGQAV
ncbi:ABC transporter ATP-binding protein [Streptomyces sp. RFCAC02]|uniref:ABC transporter ATP-binding protein n=1 Tax=Streptomyces sp. RFCAC02 TaxID=2499143 RepID=UPI001021602D|nr:ABC transporter ATP-binding protein [Streptomyces sp. RFCAC02]